MRPRRAFGACGYSVRCREPSRHLRKNQLYMWSPERDLNPQPVDYKSTALPLELPGHMVDRSGFEPLRIVSLGFYRPAQSTGYATCPELWSPEGEKWSERRDSNPRLHAPKTCALPLRYVPNRGPQHISVQTNSWGPGSDRRFRLRRDTAGEGKMPQNEDSRHPGTTGKKRSGSAHGRRGKP